MSLLITGTTLLHASPSPADASLVPALEFFFVESTRFAERLSPDGMNVAYLGPDDHGINRLWIVNLADPENPKINSSGVATAVNSFFWIGDGTLLWQSTDAEGRARLFFTETARGPTREILPNEKRRIHLEGVVDSEEPCILVGLSDDSGAFPDIYRVSLSKNEAPVLAHGNLHQIITWASDERGTLVAGLRWTDTGAKELLSLRESPVRMIFRAEPADDLRLVMASSDGNRALVITDRDSNFTHLEWISLATGSRRPFGGDPMGRVDLEGLLSAGDDILAVSYSDENLRWHSTDSAFSITLQSLTTAVGSDCLTILGIDKSRTRVLFKRFSARDPGTVFLYDTKTKTSRMLWRERPDLDPSFLSDTRPIQYTAHDGKRIPAYLTLPNEGMAPWPLVVFPHGGPRMRTHAGFDGRVQFLASRGYAVLQPNFRGSRGYGKDFMNSGDGQWGKGVMQTDVTDGVDHLIREAVADPRRIAIFGGSYGGYAALAGLAFTPDRYAAGICLFGISDLVEYATNHPPEWQAFAGDTTRRLGDPTTVEGRNTLFDLSPVNHAPLFKAPLLIYHGANDNLIPVTHARRMVEALQHSGNDVEFLLASDEAHGFSNPESEMAVYRAIELFLRKHLGGKVGPTPAETVTRRLTGFRKCKR
jgi:dipeptidyl aminopeptidase/acylaminoacyl peptidase